MENVNIAELLKDAPRGMELYSPLCGTCKLYDVNDYTIRIETPNKDTLISLYHDGRYCSNGEIMLFPKNKTTWEGFVPPCEFKDGDIVATSSGTWIGITTGGKSCKFMPTYCVINGDGKFEAYLDRKGTWQFSRFATEEEKAKLFDTIKSNGYKWNEKTKTLEKLIKLRFKIGNRIKSKINQYEYIIIDIAKDCYIVRYKTDKFEYHIPFYDEDNFDLIHNKFDITTLKPFESKVLVRDNVDEVWLPCFFGGICNGDNNYRYRIVGGERWKCCIPYEGNEHLLNKTADCSEYYKNW